MSIVGRLMTMYAILHHHYPDIEDLYEMADRIVESRAAEMGVKIQAADGVHKRGDAFHYKKYSFRNGQDLEIMASADDLENEELQRGYAADAKTVWAAFSNFDETLLQQNLCDGLYDLKRYLVEEIGNERQV